MGARAGQRDIFIHIEYMDNTDPYITPRIESLQKVRDAFLSHNIQIHFDVGNLFSKTLDPDKFNLSGDVSHKVNFRTCTEIPDQLRLCKPNQVDPRCCSSLYEFSGGMLDAGRKAAFRYLLFGFSQNADGSAGSSGIAELPGNKFLVTLGNWSSVTDDQATSEQNLTKLITYHYNHA